MPEKRGGPLPGLESALLAAAINPGLRSILLFDTDLSVLGAVANALERLLSLADGRPVVRRFLGAALYEDDLWVRPDLSAEDGRLSITRQFGALAAGVDGACLPLVVVPDLAELSLAAARGAVTLIGADVAHLERYGTSRQWLPDACWLAACDRANIGKISPHLLDRFALRLVVDWAPSREERIADIRGWALGKSAVKQEVSNAAIDRLHSAVLQHPKMSPEALERVLDIQGPGENVSSRRAITLARLAMACAQLNEHMSVAQQDVDTAAAIMNLSMPKTENTAAVPRSGSSKSKAAPGEGPIDGSNEQISSDNRPESISIGAGGFGPTAIIADAPEPLPQADLPEELAGPYPEDHAAPERYETALRETPVRFRSATIPRGSIIGVQRARSVHDLALLSTVLVAATWRPYRRLPGSDEQGDGRLRLLPSDLRTYRRAPAPEQLLVLVMDYTCLDGWDWSVPVLPFLRWAYVERAGVVLVRVGAADTPAETRADQLAARNLLDPRLDDALNARSGRATPLAHGLFLARQALRHGLQHGEGNVRRARLVVVTDGRGNVPLELDNDLGVLGPVGRAGVEDALEVASSIRSMAAVEIFLVDPMPDIQPELVSELARALGAELVPGRQFDDIEETEAAS